MKTLVNYEYALRAIDNQIAKKGKDYIYRTPSFDGEFACAYFDKTSNGEEVPGCIIGHWFDDVGIHNSGDLDEHVSDDFSRSNLWYPNIVEIDSLLNYLDDQFEFTDKAILFLRRVQEEQDAGKSWGEARDIAVNVCENEFYQDTF